MTKPPGMKKIINKLWKEPPILNVGKNGVNQNFINEFIKQLKKNKVIKIKILKSALNNENKEKIFSDIASQGNANCVEVRGNQAIFSKK